MTPARARAVLGLTADADAAAVRRAYADHLRAIDPDADPAGFAALRDARDTALAAIRRQAAPAEDDPFAATEQVEPAPPAEWPHAAPRLDRPDAPTITAQPPQLSEAPLFAAHGNPASAPSDAPLTIDHWPFAIPRVGHLSPQDAEILSDHGRWAALDGLLNGPDLAIPLTDEETARAEGHLAAVLRLIDGLPIGHSAEAEEALAQMLARAWSRSAPLLESAASAFGWEGEHGKLNERPAIAFLNARLRGLRFYEKVQRKDHPLHRAWVELSKPGYKRSWFAKRSEIANLLTGVRQNFPELEHHLDQQRVAAWELKLWPPGPVGRPGFVDALSSRNLTILFGVVAIRIVIAIFGISNMHSFPSQPPPVQPPDQAAIALDHATQAWFGPNTSFASLQQRAPWLSRVVAYNAGGTFADATADRAMRDAILVALHSQVPDADHATLRAIQKLRLAWLDRSAKFEAAACVDLMQRNLTDDRLTVPPEERGEAARLINLLATADKLNESPAPKSVRAMIPGSVIGRIMADTGLSEAQVKNAMHRNADNPSMCAVDRAEMREAMKLPGSTGDAILRVK